MDYIAKLGLVFFVIGCYLTVIESQDVCVQKGPCTCAFSNGTGIDLTSISKADFYSAQMYMDKKEGIELSTYYYHPCYDVMPPPPMNVPDNGSTCNKNLTICRHVFVLALENTTNTYKKDAGVYNFIGETKNSSFSSNGESIIYGNVPSQTIVHLVCAETEDEFHVTSLNDPKQIELSLYSRAACLKALDLPSEGGRSLGSTLLIVFFSCTIFYLVLGICTKKFLMGATSVEIIPNLAFWSDLPNLVKDGWAFTIAGFKLPVRGSGPALSPDPNSYDSI